jgi:hypothetical protein
MTAIEFLSDLRSRGVQIEANGDRLVIDAPRGVLNQKVKESLTRYKAELLALLTAYSVSETGRLIHQAMPHTSKLMSEDAGPCPHCLKPLLVFSQPEENIIKVECPEGRMSKLLRLAEDESAQADCSDCSRMPAFLTGRCPECIQRLLLCPDECQKCGGSAFWRYRASDDKPAGFAWYCANCRPPCTRNVARYEVW